jgi:hypothetical protein
VFFNRVNGVAALKVLQISIMLVPYLRHCMPKGTLTTTSWKLRDGKLHKFQLSVFATLQDVFLLVHSFFLLSRYLHLSDTPGLIADLIRFRLRLPRAYCFCIVSTLFVVSQLSAISVNDVAHLWKATALLGLAYGSLFGICPTIVIDWFGLCE